MFIVTIAISTYYNAIICWTIIYLIKSFTKCLPWSCCHNSWNTPFCLERGTTDTLTTVHNGTEFQQSSTMYTGIVSDCNNATDKNNVTKIAAFGQSSTNVTGHWRTPAEEYWK